MNSLGSITDKPEIVRENVIGIQQELEILLLKVNKFNRNLDQLQIIQGKHLQDLMRSMGLTNNTDTINLNSYQELEDQKTSIERKIKLWIELYFDSKSKEDLKTYFFPKNKILFMPNDYEQALRGLSKEIKNLLDKLIDTIGRLNYYRFLNNEGQIMSEKVTSKDINRTKIFVAYSHQDKEYLDRLIVHLKPLEKSKKIEIWSDQKIKQGQKWKIEIENALKSSRIAILLVSADFLASDFISDHEVPEILKLEESKGLTVIPIFVSPCYIPQEISQFQGSASPDKPLANLSKPDQESAFTKLFVSIQEIIEKTH